MKWIYERMKKETCTVFLIIVLAIVSAGRAEPLKGTYNKSLFALVIILVMGLGYAASISWTTVGSHYYMGMQRRYLIPVLPLFFLLFSGTLTKQVHYKTILYGSLLLNCYSIFCLVDSAIW